MVDQGLAMKTENQQKKREVMFPGVELGVCSMGPTPQGEDAPPGMDHKEPGQGSSHHDSAPLVMEAPLRLGE